MNSNHRRYNIIWYIWQWLATGLWFSPGPPVSSTNKTDCHDITEILLKVALTPFTKLDWTANINQVHTCVTSCSVTNKRVRHDLPVKLLTMVNIIHVINDVFITPKTLIYVAFQSFDFEHTCWSLLQKRVLRTECNFYVLIRSSVSFVK